MSLPACAYGGSRRGLRAAKRQLPHRAAVHNLLISTFEYLPLPADVAISRGERLLQAASGDAWAEAAILVRLSLYYGSWPAGRCPRRLPAQPGHIRPGRGETQLG